jgi:hypothetical protein
VNAILGVDTDGETDTSRALNIEHVGPLVPGVGIVLDVVLTIVDDEGTVLLEESEQRGAAGAAIEPDNDRVVLRVALGFHEHVVKLLGGTCCQIA